MCILLEMGIACVVSGKDGHFLAAWKIEASVLQQKK
jgi:hypothetical protein